MQSSDNTILNGHSRVGVAMEHMAQTLLNYPTREVLLIQDSIFTADSIEFGTFSQAALELFKFLPKEMYTDEYYNLCCEFRQTLGMSIYDIGEAKSIEMCERFEKIMKPCLRN